MPDKKIITKPTYKAEDFISTYANNVQFALTGWDIVIRFGNVNREDTETTTEIQIEQHTEIRIGWQQAKVAALLFAINVAAQEEVGGPIKIPSGVIPHIVPDDKLDMSMDDIVRELIRKQDAERVAPPAPIK
jgi:hypothetical protein